MNPPSTPLDAPAAPAAPDAGADRLRGRLMQASLKALLDRVRGAREALPHLAALEAALGKQGAAAIDAVPLHWRARIGSQLSSLPLPDDDAPLLDLQQRLLASLAPPPANPAQPAQPAQPAPPAPPAPLPPAAPLRPLGPAPDSDFASGRNLDVSEVSHSEFMAVAAGRDPRRDENR